MPKTNENPSQRTGATTTPSKLSYQKTTQTLRSAAKSINATTPLKATSVKYPALLAPYKKTSHKRVTKDSINVNNPKIAKQPKIQTIASNSSALDDKKTEESLPEKISPGEKYRKMTPERFFKTVTEPNAHAMRNKLAKLSAQGTTQTQQLEEALQIIIQQTKEIANLKKKITDLTEQNKIHQLKDLFNNNARPAHRETVKGVFNLKLHGEEFDEVKYILDNAKSVKEILDKIKPICEKLKIYDERPQEGDLRPTLFDIRQQATEYLAQKSVEQNKNEQREREISHLLPTFSSG